MRFESLPDLYAKLSRLDLEDVRRRMAVFARRHEQETLEAWRAFFEPLGVAVSPVSPKGEPRQTAHAAYQAGRGDGPSGRGPRRSAGCCSQAKSLNAQGGIDAGAASGLGTGSTVTAGERSPGLPAGSTARTVKRDGASGLEAAQTHRRRASRELDQAGIVFVDLVPVDLAAVVHGVAPRERQHAGREAPVEERGGGGPLNVSQEPE